METTWDTITVGGGAMRCYVAARDGASAVPGVVVIQHAGGVDDFIQTMTRRIADAGYAAIAPDLYHRDDPASSDDAMTRMGRLRDANIVTDVRAAIDHIQADGRTDGQRIGITGFCMGGRVAYLLATRDERLRAAVVFYGGNIMVPWGGGPAPFEGTADIACPILGLFGSDDANPSPADVKKLDSELTRLGKSHEFQSYAGAGHAFMNEGRPSYRAEAAADAWTKCVGWFDRHLR